MDVEQAVVAGDFGIHFYSVYVTIKDKSGGINFTQPSRGAGMEQIVVQIRDKEKAKVLFELLAALDFVDSVQTIEGETAETISAAHENQLDFFSLAGLWQDREVTLDSIRQKAWPRQY